MAQTTVAFMVAFLVVYFLAVLGVFLLIFGAAIFRRHRYDFNPLPALIGLFALFLDAYLVLETPIGPLLGLR